MKRTNVFNTMVIFLLIGSLWLNVNLFYKVDIMQKEIGEGYSSFSNQLSHMNSNLSQFTHDVNKQLQWIGESDYRVVGISDDYSQMELEFTFTLNELSHDEDLYLLLMTEDQQETKVVVPASESLAYTVRAMVNEENYMVSLLGVGAETSRNQGLDHLYLKDMINDLVQIEGEIYLQRHSPKDETVEANFFIAISNEPSKGLKGIEEVIESFDFASVIADVYMGSEKLDTIDLLTGEGFVETDPGKVSMTPEYVVTHESDVTVTTGTYIFKGPIYQEYLEVMNSGETGIMGEATELFFVVTATDSRGIVYRQVVGSHFYELDGDKLVLPY